MGAGRGSVSEDDAATLGVESGCLFEADCFPTSLHTRSQQISTDPNTFHSVPTNPTRCWGDILEVLRLAFHSVWRPGVLTWSVVAKPSDEPSLYTPGIFTGVKTKDLRHNAGNRF